jgi:DNA-binding XRE family transcriptional regulator
MTPSIIKSGDTLTIYCNGRVYALNSSVPNWERILNLIKAKDWENLPAELDIAVAVSARSGGRAELIDGQVFLDGQPQRNVVSERILDMVADGFDIDPMLRFLENVYRNPAPWAIDELFLFLETNRLPITDDGCFLAYKVVNKDYTDCYTGRISNQVGEKPKMKREDVDPVRDHHCSRGFHFCSYEYIAAFMGYYDQKRRLMLLKVNPADVVSIPSDYNNTKGRCWKYEVIDEIDITTRQRHIETAPSVVVSGEVYNPLTLDMILDMFVQEMRELDMEFDGITHPFEGDAIDLEEIFLGLERHLKVDLMGVIDTSEVQYSTIERICREILEKVTGKTEEALPESENEYDSMIRLFGFKRNPQGSDLKEAREARGVTGQALANHLGVSRSAVWSFENSLKPKPETVTRVLRALNEIKKQ